MPTMLIVSVVFCVAGLIAWRWYLENRKWELTHKTAARDEALAELSPRMTALEKRLTDLQYSKAFK